MFIGSRELTFNAEIMSVHTLSTITAQRNKQMSTIDCLVRSPTRSMFPRFNSVATRLVRNSELPPITYRPTTALSSLSPNASTTVTMNEDAVNSHDLDVIFQRKQSLRSKVRKELKNMDPIQRTQEDNVIQNIVLESPWFKSSRSLCAYISCPALREVDTSRIVAKILSNPINENNIQVRSKLYVPHIEDKSSNMRMLKISSSKDLVANSMDILEPVVLDTDGSQCEDAMEASEPVDLFILPGLAFDRSGGRLGRGGGYYDVYLKKYKQLAEERKWKQPLLVALSYSLQIMEEGSIPVTPYDVPVDALVSPSGFIPITPVASQSCN